jgi:hypothetical protein
MRLLILLIPICLVFGIHSSPKNEKDPVFTAEQTIDSLNIIEISPNAHTSFGGTSTDSQWKGTEAIAQATTVPRQLPNKEQTIVKENVVTAAGQAQVPPATPVLNPSSDSTKELSDFLKSVAPWLQGNNPANISMSFIDVATNKIFCDRYEPFSSFAELDFRIWIKERQMSVAHVATNEAFGIIPVQCGVKENARYSVFFNNQINTRDDQLTIAIKVYESDQMILDSKAKKLSKMMKDNLDSTGNISVDKSILAESYVDTFFKKLSLLLYPITVWDDIFDALFAEVPITTFEIDLFRKALYLPSTENVGLETRGFEVLVEGGGKDFMEIKKLRSAGIDFRDKDFTNKLIAIRYRFTTEANHLKVTYELTVKRI